MTAQSTHSASFGNSITPFSTSPQSLFGRGNVLRLRGAFIQGVNRSDRGQGLCVERVSAEGFVREVQRGKAFSGGLAG